MKNKNITQNIAGEYNLIAENPSDDIWVKIENGINTSEYAADNKKIHKILMKPILAAVIFVLLISAVAAGAPLILKMLGSDIGFFNSEKQTRFSADQELIKQYSSEVGITAQKDGFSLTVDNVAFDGTFLNVFYTIKSERNLFEEAKEATKQFNNPYIELNTLIINEVRLELPGSGYQFLHDKYFYASQDGYFVSDYELKGVRRHIITKDLPEVFDIEISYHYFYNRMEFWDKYRGEDGISEPVPICVNLTIDMSESKIKTKVVSPDAAAKITQPRCARFYDEADEYPSEVVHDIIIDRVSISPLGNILVMTEKGGDNPVNRELLSKYYIVDDRGNFYGRTDTDMNARKEWEKDETSMVEFYGRVPEDILYLKLIPYNGEFDFGVLDYSELNSLPKKLNYSKYGKIIIESCDVTDETVTFRYRYEGMVEHPLFTLVDENRNHLNDYSWIIPTADRNANLYTIVYTFKKPLKNAKNIVKGIGLYCMDIELLEDQSVIIPMK